VAGRCLLPAVAAAVACLTLHGPVPLGADARQYTVHRIEEDGARDTVSLTTLRIRPVMPGKAASPSRATPATTGK